MSKGHIVGNHMLRLIYISCSLYTAPQECVPKNQFSYFSTKIYVVGTKKNRLIETVLLSTQKHMLKLIGKNIFTILRLKLLLV